MRIGLGYDSHRFVEGRDLILGGVKIRFDKGLLGHSDADVLVHAICDALLGAIAEGDIGQHFPDSDPEYKGISSLKLLTKVLDLVQKKSFEVENVDSIIIAERPKISPYVTEIRNKLAEVFGIEAGQISIKCKTNESMGFIGRLEGIAALAVVLLRDKVIV